MSNQLDNPETKASWQRPEGGGRFAIWLIRTIGLVGGRGLARLILYPITLYFFCRRGRERRNMRNYLARLQGRPGSTLQVMRIIFNFSSTLLDRVFFLSRGGADFLLQTEGVEVLDKQLARNRGLLLVGSHFGSFEALRALALQRGDTDLHIVLDKQQTPDLTRLLEELAPEISRKVIDLSRGGPEAVVAMAEALGQGAPVGLLADRARGAEVCVAVPFLGEAAYLPVTPWQLAATLNVPVVLCFGVYLGGNRYRLSFEHFSDGIQLDRAGREAALQAVVARYAARLEHYTRLHPYNWFNFHDIWKAPDADAGREVRGEP